MQNLKSDVLVSVVVPIYKVEKYIRKCVDSIINQTYKNLEIILVDDGTPDNCGKICDEYELSDKRIKVIHKKNGGLSDARNAGLRIASGTYICFIDSDDYVSNYFVEKLLNAALMNECDISVCNFEYVDEDGKTWIRKEKEERVYSSKKALKDIFTSSQDTEVMVWNKLYKRSLFIENDIEYPVGKIHEDNFTTYKLYDKANKICLINDKLYYYLQRSSSIMGVKFNEKRFDVLLALEETKKYFEGDNSLKSELEFYEMSIYFSLLNAMVISDYNGIEKKGIRDKILANKKQYFKNKYMTFTKKMMINVLSLSFGLYSKMFIFLKKQ